MQIAILGAGAYGKALGGVLKENGRKVKYYDPYVYPDTTLAEVLVDADAILLAVPSDVAESLLPALPRYTPLIVATKGFLGSEVFEEFDYVMVISGPGFAKDIEKRVDTYLTTTDRFVVGLFGGNCLQFELTNDFEGVLMCGALKNVYAIGAGLLGLDPDTKAMERYLRGATLEMCMLLGENGANPKTVGLSCGIGDLILTCSPQSHNYSYGKDLHDGKKPKKDVTVEGVETLCRIREGGLKVPEVAETLRWLLDEVR